MRITWLAVFVAACSCAVTPSPVPPTPIEDAGPTADAPECKHTASCVCAKLCELACQDCMPECVDVVDHIIQERLIQFDPQCILDAADKFDVRECPGVRCP